MSADMTKRHMPTLRTYPRRVDFCPLAPDPELMFIEDIAHGLATNNRFCGYTPEPYNNAHHSIIVAELIAEAGFDGLWQLCGLLHEVGEAYSGFGDVHGGMKHYPMFAEQLKPLEHAIETAAARRFVLPAHFATDPIVKNADRIAYHWENRDLREIAPPRGLLLPKRLVPMGWREARDAFLAMYEQLKGAAR